ncbi:MAG TPA: DUF1385 domain-containing protein [Clostridiaceae bacterium]|jgi:uncharacterized protein YqhQ|nr:DUF1385 domain-containing protein [Clostridiaceae bacterium]
MGSTNKYQYGGEALIEGVMMKGKKNIAIAVRKSNGEIHLESRPLKTLSQKYKFLKWPVLRGAVGMIETMVLGVKSLMYSAEFFEDAGDDSEPSKFDKFLEKVFGEKLQDAVIYFSVIVALAAGIGLFFLLPNVLTELFGINKDMPGGTLISNLLEGSIRIMLFLGYIVLVSKMKDVRRVFEYHGAEHKSIHCYENKEELTVENVKKYTTRHPRCGTALLFVVMLMSILVFSLVGRYSVPVNILLRLLLIPLIAGLSYEVVRFAGKSDALWVRIISAPGLALQKFTTREPDAGQMEVAIAALKEVIQNEEKGEEISEPTDRCCNDH